jgi:thiamine-monophosphate kinase
MPTLQEIGEDELIHRLTHGLPMTSSVLAGPGDDCAVVEGSEYPVLLKADAVIEGVHFLPDAQPELIGRKALARAISDIAAMGGLPRHALITLVLRPDLEVAWVESIYRGMSELAQAYNVSIVGGETCRGPVCIISVAMTGEANHGQWISRGGAWAGDLVFVTGRLGGSIKGRHFTFEPRLEEAQWLMRFFRPSAMMDLSDGLAKDLPRLAKASGVEFAIDEGLIPCTEGCTPAQAWGDGEDYELLFTISSESAQGLLEEWRVEFDTPLTMIGRLTASGDGLLPTFESTGWDHFSQSS